MIITGANSGNTTRTSGYTRTRKWFAEGKTKRIQRLKEEHSFSRHFSFYPFPLDVCEGGRGETHTCMHTHTNTHTHTHTTPLCRHWKQWLYKEKSELLGMDPGGECLTLKSMVNGPGLVHWSLWHSGRSLGLLLNLSGQETDKGEIQSANTRAS